MKRNNDYDNVLKTLESKHKRLFISVINDALGTDYDLDAEVELLEREGFLEERDAKGGKKLVERETDFLIRIGGRTFIIECQTYDDDSMAIRIAEYAFIAARKLAKWTSGSAVIPMPNFVVVYIKSTERTPKKTSIAEEFAIRQTPEGTVRGRRRVCGGCGLGIFQGRNGEAPRRGRAFGHGDKRPDGTDEHDSYAHYRR